MSNNGNGQHAPTNGKQWRLDREKGTLITFPFSGFSARVRSIDASIIAVMGRIPDGLTPLVAAGLESRTGDEAGDSLKDTFEQMDKAERFKMQAEFALHACRCGFIEPRIVDNPQGDDEISIDDVHPLDALFYVRWLNRAAGDLDFFRPQQDSDVESVPDEPTDSPAAVRNPAPE